MRAKLADRRAKICSFCNRMPRRLSGDCAPLLARFSSTCDVGAECARFTKMVKTATIVVELFCRT